MHRPAELTPAAQPACAGRPASWPAAWPTARLAGSAQPAHRVPLPRSSRSSGRPRGAAELCAGLALTLLGLAACATHPTPYQPLGDDGGYEEARLGERIYRVSFRGNRYTAETAVLDFLFIRCAELTRQQGFTHFVVQEDFGRTQVTSQPSARTGVGIGTGFSGGRSFWGLGFSGTFGARDYEAAISYHLAVFVMRMLTAEEAKAETGQAYEAEFILRSLGAKRTASAKESS